HGAPPAPDVEKALARLQIELSAYKINLLGLRFVQGGVLVGEDGACVSHRGPEDPLVEPVGHVVVVADRTRVALQRVTQPPPEAGAGLGGRRRHRLEDVQTKPAQDFDPVAPAEGRHVVTGKQRQSAVDVALDVKVSSDVSPRETEVTGSRGDVIERARVLDPDTADGVGRAGAAAVEGFEADAGREGVGQHRRYTRMHRYLR